MSVSSAIVVLATEVVKEVLSQHAKKSQSKKKPREEK
jgi:hypothetical protein